MAPLAATVLSHVEGVSDSARQREVYKYYTPPAPSVSVENDVCFPPTVEASSKPSATSSSHGPPQNILADSDVPTSSRDILVESDVTSSKISSPDTALTSFCQLLTWRTGAQRAMIGLIDADTQYFVAESTPTVDLVDADIHGPGDSLWMGCSAVSKAGKLCERTIDLPPSKTGEYPSFVVNDLSKDERFNQLPFITSSPNLRFYAGVPLITKRGIAIGSLFIVDDRVWDGLPKEKIKIMGDLAKTVMNNLEMSREAEQHRRGMKMSRGLASFVEGKSELIEPDVDIEEGEGMRIAGQFQPDLSLTRTHSRASHSHSIPGSGANSIIERKEREYSTSMMKTEKILRDVQAKTDAAGTRPDLNEYQETSYTSLDTRSSITVSSPPTNEKSSSGGNAQGDQEESSQKLLCSRAANLIREAFEVDGGCVFFDAQSGPTGDPRRAARNHGSSADDTQDSSAENQANSGDDALFSPLYVPDRADKSTSADSSLQASKASPYPSPLGDASSPRYSTSSTKAAEPLAFSTPSASSIHGDERPGDESFRLLEEKNLQTLFRRFPRGKLWTFDSDGSMSSSSEDDNSRPITKDRPKRVKESNQRKAKDQKAKSDSRFLTRHFPGVRQLLFVPLWDAGRSRWLSGCFVWSTEATRVLSKQSELSFLTAFCNSVMAEWSRIDTELANQKKGDFIGSISHELRSPLHGILNSAELLSEAVTGIFEKGMLETISSCGKTLLDTINHVLDYSKINSFERTWRKAKGRHNQPTYDPNASKADLPMINLYADIDVALVCEEVMESVFAGHTFQNNTASNFDMVKDLRDNSSTLGRMDGSTGSDMLPKSEVGVIFDVDHGDYRFTTQPGAFRRVVMNLLGNALKYTSHGYVRVKITCSPMDDFVDPETAEIIPQSTVTISVSDTGKGISKEFLLSKIFIPFAQENSLSSGTGLGLSIVRSIVRLLEGEITIDSDLGKGTQVRVKLPLRRGLPRNIESASTNPPKSINSPPQEADDSMAKLRPRLLGKKVSLHGFDTDSVDPAIQKMGKLLKSSVSNFLVQWYGLQIVPLGRKASIIISNDADSATVRDLLHENPLGHGRRPAVIVLCGLTQLNRRASQVDLKYNVGYVSKPVGPLKLGKAIAQCLEGIQTTPSLPDGPGAESDLSNVFEEMSVNPKRGEMLDNSRMAADSDNARKALESPTPNALIEKAAEFPFPAAAGTSPTHHRLRLPAPKERDDLPLGGESSKPGFHISDTVVLREDSLKQEVLPKPSFLLVDDNAINLTLLSTSMSRRAHSTLDTAMDGLAAVKKFEDRAEGYDIIFMDISMPLLDGFGATKEIRAIEQKRKAGSEAFTPALIIALTGLASSEDQATAVTVGVDLFLTKPVSFKEVKKILDNWEANRGKETGSGSGSGS
ncbi:Autoinducer 2 sensor kinase/phosphatase LuxQ [Lachnellula suecica]|uniref:histidine kinase n=1 Tax=Lachnellula suecica TaxID=602035 RepID=A0A8T9C680_9HELO|nr:Autoinducer 2 sensor kinase/phosphatase LuxQ [Lachnellula suecica]